MSGRAIATAILAVDNKGKNMTFLSKRERKRVLRDTKQDNPIATLATMLQTMRPAKTDAVDRFVDDWILPLGAQLDHAGNAILRVGEGSRVLWSSHTDTVHRAAGRQRISVNGDCFKVAYGDTASCLGADCTTGVWIMREMILAGVAGLYVFHADEEIGGHGSAWLAKSHAGLLDGVDFAIAFDRKGTDSIITHQWGGRCCSDTFARSLASQLPNAYRTDDTGTFTDTANYVDAVAECTNISVGYYGQHTASETQSISHALALRDAMLRFDETKLVKSRKAGEIDIDDYDGLAWDWSRYGKSKRSHKATASSYYDRYDHGARDYYDRYSFDQRDQLADYVYDNPDGVADFLEMYGFSLDEIRDHVDRKTKGKG